MNTYDLPAKNGETWWITYEKWRADCDLPVEHDDLPMKNRETLWFAYEKWGFTYDTWRKNVILLMTNGGLPVQQIVIYLWVEVIYPWKMVNLPMKNGGVQ